MEQITMVPLEQLHPHEQNPRIDAASVTDLVESIRVHGIEVPLVAAPQLGTDGYVVVAGHRRLTAAHELTLAEVPVQIREDLAAARDQLAFMATENLHRDQLTAVEESRLVQDMLDLGMTQTEIAKQTALGKQRVKERVKLGKLAEQTGDKVHRGQITVDDALVIAEYADDPDTVEELEQAAGTYNFDFYASRAKARSEARKAVDTARKQAKKEGLRLVGDDDDFVPLAELLTENAWTTPALDEAAEAEVSGQAWDDLVHTEHATCPGHSALIIEQGHDAGTIEVGCDQVTSQHATNRDEATDDTTPEPEPDPLDRFTPEDLQTMRYDRESKVHTALTTTDLTHWAIDNITQRAVAVFDRLDLMGRGYKDAALGFLGLPTDATDTAITKAIKQLPWPARYAFAHVGRAALFHHIPMSESAYAWQWKAHPGNHVNDLLLAIGAEPSDLEKELRALHDAPWDTPTTDDADGAALAGGGEAA